MADIDVQEPLSNISDSSFVILGHGSLPSTDAQENPKEKTDSLTNNKSTFSVIESTNNSTNDRCHSNWLLDGSSLYEEDTQKKLDEILKENSQLKETLVQNNLAVKSQLDTFFMWQQEVLKTHEIHKQKFLETKELILKLRAENINLKKQLEESPVKVPKVNGDAQVEAKPKELDELKERMKEFEEICNNLTGKNENLVKENEKLREELKAENREIINLNKKLQGFESDVENLKQSFDSSKKNSLESSVYRSLPNIDAQMQISNLLKELEETKRNATKLREELEKLKSGNAEVKKSTTKELNWCVDKIDNINASLDLQNQTFSSLQSWVALAGENLKESNERVVNNLSEINKSQGQVNRKEQVFAENQDLESLKGQFHKLLLDYQELQQQLNETQKNDPNIENYKAKISGLSSKLEAKERELVSKEEECKRLQEVIKSLQAECEETEALKVQVQLHRADFIDERKQKDLLIAENEQLAEKIELLESTILVLEHEKVAPQRNEETLCPRCVQSFPDLAVYQTHLEECCNMDYFY